MVQVIRKDTQAVIGADGEFSALQVDSDGALRVANEVNDAPWSCTGFKTADAVVKAAAGVLGTIQLAVTALSSAAVSLFPSFSLLPLLAIMGADFVLVLAIMALVVGRPAPAMATR